MVNSIGRLRRQAIAVAIATLSLPGVTAAQTPTNAKLDESLRESVERGCVGSKPVIVTAKAGYRQQVRELLVAHGDIVRGEFPALEAIAADVHCADLPGLASLDSTVSISLNGSVGVQGLLTSELSVTSTSTTTFSTAQSAVTAARAALVTAKAEALAAQKAVRAAQSALSLAKAQVAAAKRALLVANKLTGLAQTLAVATAEAQMAQAQLAEDAAEAALGNARSAATLEQAAALKAQNDLVAAQEALADAKSTVGLREREGKAAHDLKRKFFATMPVRASHEATDEEIDTEAVDYSAFEGPTTYGGNGIGIAVIDSGIEPGPDFDDRITAFYDFTQGDIRAVAPIDQYGHGTHVAGLIASEFVGMAPNARLIGLRVLDQNGQGATANVVRAIEFAIANKNLLGINLLNLSLGHPIYEPAATDPLVQAVEHAAREGIIVVVSAGNFGINSKTGQPGYAGIASPGNSPSAITVGAARTFNTVTRLDDRVAPYSSRGPSWYDGFAKPDVAAPGDNLLSIAAANSTLRAAQERRGNTGNYMRLSGTSMAAGVTSGVVALVLHANRGLTPNTVKAVLEYTAIPLLDDLGKLFDPLAQGAGQIEVSGAVAMARAIDPTAPMGTSWLNTSLTTSTRIGGKSYAWAQSIIWGARRVSGAKLLAEQRPAFALNIVWGEGLGSEDDNIVWGNNFDLDDNIVWGNSLDLDDNIVWGNNIVWGVLDDDNIVWGNLFGLEDDNIVWGNNIVWGSGLIGILEDDNIVWGNLFDDNIVWGNLFDDNIVWGNLFDDNIVWGNTLEDDNIVWGNNSELGSVFRWSGGTVAGKATNARARKTMARKEGVR